MGLGWPVGYTAGVQLGAPLLAGAVWGKFLLRRQIEFSGTSIIQYPQMILKAPGTLWNSGRWGHGRGKGRAIQLEQTSGVKDRRASGMTGSEPGLSPPPVSAMLIVRRKRKLPCPRLQIRAELSPHIGTISEITRLTSECGYILNQYLLQKFLLKVLFQCESNLQWKGDGDFRKTDAKIPTEYMENHVISLDSCGEYYLAVDGEIGGRP